MRLLWMLLPALFFTQGSAGAQVQRILHQEFAVSDSITEIRAALYGDYLVEPWPGNNVLLESQIKLYNATEGILKHYLEAGRYELLSEYQGPVLVLTARDLEHPAIKTNRGESFEDLQQRLFIPEDFQEVGQGHWTRPPKERKQTVVPPNPAGGSPPQTKPQEGGSGND